MKPIAPQRDYGEARGLKKGPWSAGEDWILIEYVKEHGEGNWNAVQRSTPLDRCGKSCRLRWANHLRPNLKKGSFSPDEERLIIDLHSSLGNKWARISAHLPGRTDNEVKNYWNTRVKRRLRQGLPLYPNSHLPPPLPPPPPPLPHLKIPPSFLDPTSLPFPTPFFAFSQPSMRIPPSSFLFGPNSDPSGLGLGFPSMLELPSNQFRPESVTDDEEFIDEAKFNPNVYERSDNSGLLDALLQESQSRAEAANSLKKDCLDGGDDRWDSIFGNSSTGGDKGVAKMEDSEDHTNYTNEDLSSILNLIPSRVKAPKWKDGRDASAGKLYNISDDSAAGLDVPQFPRVSSSNDTEWLNGSGPWDNLPRIC